jgi:hypothetical protein
MTGEARCGTPSGWTAHKNRDEKPCDACARAKRLYDERRRSAPAEKVKSRNAAAAQARARKRLIEAHREEYQRYYAEEKARTDDGAST